ncbi:MAG: chemotaxis protein CheB, partial [Acidobacteria bacterium]|nr:chemotaxis protein CheB [Acidobacteriota bacterium]
SNIGPLPAAEGRDGERIENGRIYVAKADHHLVIDGDRLRVSRGPKENRFRPAIDPLFRSAAYSYGKRVIGVILSGALDDGTSGLWEVKRRRGIAIVQDPRDAEIASMPESAMLAADPDHVVPADEIARLLVRLSQQDAGSEEVRMAHDDRTKQEIKIAAEDNAFRSGVFQSSELTPFTCPECSGVLAKLVDGDRVRFRCHTGHAFSADSLLAALTENIEESLWSAVRGMDESIMLLNHLGDHFAEVNSGSLAAKFFQKAKEAAVRNERIRHVVLDHELLTTGDVEREAGTNPAPVSSLSVVEGTQR